METIKGIFTPFYKLNARNTVIMVVFQLLLLLLLWSLSSYKFLPTPIEVFHAFLSLKDDSNLLAETVTSFWLCIKSMFWATIISCIVTYSYKIPFFKYPALLTTKFRFLSMVGLDFFFRVLCSDSDSLKVSILSFSITVFFITGYIAYVKDIDESQIKHSMTTGLGPWETLYRVVVKGTVANMLEVMAQTFAMGWMMITMVEGMVRSGGGIGVLLLNEEKTIKLDYIMALQIVVLIVGILVDWFIRYTKNTLFPWSKR